MDNTEKNYTSLLNKLNDIGEVGEDRVDSIEDREIQLKIGKKRVVIDVAIELIRDTTTKDFNRMIKNWDLLELIKDAKHGGHIHVPDTPLPDTPLPDTPHP